MSSILFLLNFEYILKLRNAPMSEADEAKSQGYSWLRNSLGKYFDLLVMGASFLFLKVDKLIFSFF